MRSQKRVSGNHQPLGISLSNWQVLGKFDFLHLIMMHLEGKLTQVYDGNYFFSIFIFVICSTEFPQQRIQYNKKNEGLHLAILTN